MRIDVLAQHVDFAKNGDQMAFSELVKATQNATTAIALSIVKDVDASEDVAQQAYIKVWQQLPQLQKTQSFLPWLRQITRYTAINYLRDNKVEQRLSSEHADDVIASIESEILEGDLALSERQIKTDLARFIDELPSESRELILLYYREEQSTQQVARLLELSEANVRQKISRARQRLKEDWLAKHGKLILSTAPGIGFTTLIANLVSATSPAAATTLGASVSATQTSIFAKIVALLGGAFLGAIMAIGAVFLSTKMVLNRISDDTYRTQIIRVRNFMFLWILLFGALITLSYEFTHGWWGPVLSYALFAIGLVRLIEAMQLLSAKAGLKNSGKWCIAPTDNSWRRKLANWAGPVMGGIGLLSGLISSGRLVV
ncbi:sigma-70 family RNA polymerase sigma factor [Alteromonas sp. KUL49]|uniref:RNA polymerase sigma factor n=1 Tax=Alteromonas sp. KUL49 TaxID=2480798 RepID=UPI00102F03C1|nr:sigma-70 family RNA polymerase sigma factor [Alteromonas sp. KUL49]TAP37321.1 sigma-70 family RNA polymerase sigma factor [Alteromonas sp. KUL49]GEA12945.1 hypothetical protein KUL49_33200 [Alteromonas sp. KUL49]